MTSKQLETLRVIFISKDAGNHINRLDESCSMVGKKTRMDPEPVTLRQYAYNFELRYTVDLRLCETLIKNEEHSMAADLLIGLLFTIRNWPNCFYDTDYPNDAAKILKRFGRCWYSIFNQSKEFYDYINMDTNTKEILCEIFAELAKELKDFNEMYPLHLYTKSKNEKMKSRKRKFSDIESKSNDNSNVKKKRKVMMKERNNYVQIDECDDEYNKLNKLKVSDLKKMCKEKGFYTRGLKQILIKRLLIPDYGITEMKRTFHYKYTVKKGYTWFGYIDKQFMDEQLVRLGQFDKNRYVFENGKVVERKSEWLADLRGGCLMHP
eukprot:287163_1